jgi:hypothetical protein
MQFLMMHKTNAANEAGVLPTREAIQGMGQLIGKMAAGGGLRGGEGLRASSLGVRLRFTGGQKKVTPGPFAGENELPAGFAIVRVHTIDEAVEWATKFAAVVGDVEIDIRPVMEGWDLGVCPKPEGETRTRYMIAHKATRDSEAGVPPASEQAAELDRLTAEMTKKGVLLTTVAIGPSSQGVRLRYEGGRRSMTDGPFVESKELIAGYCLLEAGSIPDVLQWADPFAAIIGDVEIDIRPVYHSSNVS